MTHSPRCSDSGNHIQQEKLPNNSAYFWEHNSGFRVSASPKGHVTAQAEAEEQHLRGKDHWVGAQATWQQPAGRQQ